MNDASRPPNERPAPRAGETSPVLQALAIALTAAAALTASATLAWSLRGWRESPEPPGAAASATVPGSATAPADRPAVLRGAGRLAYQVHCARCHGAEGHGDGADAERLAPPPRDFASGRWRFAPTSEAVRQVIVAGIPGTAMPGWGTSLSRRELDGLVAHVLALAPSPRRQTEAEGTSEGEEDDAAEPLPPALVSLLGRAGFVAEATARPAPPLALRDLDGNASSLAGHHGHPVLVLFWGTTCGHCLAEIPAVGRFADRHRDRGLEVLPVCVDEPDAAVVRDVAGPQPAQRPLYLDPTGMARLRFDVQALPTFVLIDRSGRLVARSEGARDWADPALDDLVRRGLARDDSE
jgi:mono/diheme cytochrome c family protein/thiol-disulfide isomerase/thioredoxin